MVASIREMPAGIRLFLVYALLILAGIGLSLRFVVDQAISAPVSLPGIVVMILLAYTIFTTTLVLQRKQAAYGLAIGLASLTVPLVLLLLVSPVHPALPVFTAAFGLLLFRGLLRPEVAALPVRGLTTAAHVIAAVQVPSRGAVSVAAGSHTDPATLSDRPRHHQ